MFDASVYGGTGGPVPTSFRTMTPPGTGFGMPARKPFRPPRAKSPGVAMDPRLVDILHALLQSQPAGGRSVGVGRRSGDGMGGGMMPAYAQGGIVDQPTIGLLGEAGPEAVVPLRGGMGPFSGRLTRPQTSGGADAGSTINRLLAGGSNTFTPDYLRSALRRNAMGTASSLRHRNDVLARLSGLDPMQQRQAMVESDRSASGGLAQSLNAADLQGLTSYQDFIRSLLTGERGYQQQTALQKMQNDAAIAAAKAGKPSILGELGGAAIGAATKFIPTRK